MKRGVPTPPRSDDAPIGPHDPRSHTLFRMASQLLFVNIDFINYTPNRMINNLSFYSPSTILNLRSSLSETLSIPSNHFHFLYNAKPINDNFRLIDKHTYQVLLRQPITPSPSSTGIYIAFFYHQTIHLVNVIEKKLYTCIDEPKIGYSMVYIDWSTFDEDEDYNARLSLKKDLCEEFGLDPTSSLFGIHQCPFQHIHIYQDFLEKFLEEDDEEELFEFDPEDDIDGDLLVD